MSDNPLYQRLIRDHPVPRLPGPTGVALIVAVASLVIWQSNNTISLAQIRWLILLPLGSLLLAPMLTAGYAAIVAALYARTDEYAMLRISPISPEAIVWGYVRAVLYRMQMPYAVAVGLMPLAIAVYSQTGMLRLWFGTSLAGLLFLMAGLAGDNLAAAAVGLLLGLRLRQPVAASVIAVGIFALLPVMFIAAYPAMTGGLHVGSQTILLPGPIDVLLLVVVMVTPVLSLPVLKWAERWV